MKIYVYSGTHWDREWYRSFQGFRSRLVQVTDHVIDQLEKRPDFGVFHLDGQTIVLEDYLQIRPENRDRLAALIRAGKIVIGPWYDMPDEFLISGESMIKNLQKGMAISRSWGVEPSHTAYICDIFGHSSQTPQIFAGMNLNNTVLGRGTNEHEDPAHFRWQALDGSEVLAYRLREAGGYSDFGGFMVNHSSTTSETELDAAMKEYIDDELARCEIPVLLLMDAHDHAFMRPETPRFVESIKRVYPDAEVYHVAIDEMAKEQWAAVDQLEARQGELCRTTKRNNIGYCHVITHTLSSRYPLKKYNDINQTRLEKWVSPLYAFGQTDMAPGFLTEANRYLLKNHPHDSICGCSIDQVHRDMMCRFDQTRLICDEIVNPFLATLGGDLSAQAISEPLEEGSTRRLRLYNPLPYRTKRTVTATVHVGGLPTYLEPFGYEHVPSIKLFDADGNRVPFGYVRPLIGDCYEITFEADLTPAGVTEYELRPVADPPRDIRTLLTSPRSAETDCLRMSINADGTINLYDKENDQLYCNLLTMVDDGEIGDGWYHCNPNIDTLVSPDSAEVMVIENNAIRTTFRITQKMALPKGIDRSCGITRSRETVDYRIVHEVTLARGDRGLTVHTIIDNNAEDHRLRLRLPETVAGETYEAAQAFGYVTRVCGDDPTTMEWKEYQFADRNMANICAKRSGNRGLAFVSAYGLHECGVWPNGDMDVTLMRCFSKTVGTHGEPDAQLLQTLEYDYRILPFTDSDRFADLVRDQDFLSVGLHSATVEGGGARHYAPMFEVSGRDIVYSTANRIYDDADYTSEIRVFNDGPDASTATVRLPAGATSAALTELDGRRIATLSITDGTVTFDLPAFRIATVRFV